MPNFKKLFNLKIISLLVALVFLLNSAVYGIDLSKETHLRKSLDFNDLNATPRYLCALLAVIYRNCLNHNLSPEQAFAIVMKEMDQRKAKEVGIKVEKHEGGIRIYYGAVYNDGQSGSKREVAWEPWYRRKIDASKIFDKEFIKGNHAAIIKMADDIETATSGAVKAYNVKDFDIEEYLRAYKILEGICMMEVSGPEELEQLMFELQFSLDESSNKLKDQWGYFNNYAISRIRGLLKEMFEDSQQDIIDKDPLAFAVKLFVDFVKEQPFHNGNHRTADFLINLILVKYGLPVFFLTPDNVIEYYQLTNSISLQDESFNEDDLKQIQAFFRRETENTARRAALPAQAAGSLSIYVSAAGLVIEETAEPLSDVIDKASKDRALSSSI